MPNDYDALAKRIRRKVYSTTEELKKDFVEGLAAIARQPSVDRGLTRQVVADVQGGTTLGVGDPNAANDSEYLVQNPQAGPAKNVGSGLQTRRQTRAESLTRVLSGKVMESVPAGATEVTVKVVGDGVGKAIDPVTGMEIVGNIMSPLSDSLADTEGTVYVAKMTGQPIVNAGDTGMQPIEAGRTVEVSVSDNYEVTTSWTTRDRKNLPVVVRTLKDSTAVLVNGFASPTSIVCTPTILASPNVPVLPLVANPGVSLAAYTGDGIGCPNMYWRVVYYSEFYRPAIDFYPWIHAGRINAAGKLLGLPATIFAVEGSAIPPTPDGVTPYPGNPAHPDRSYGSQLQFGCRHGDEIWWPHFNLPTPVWQFVTPFLNPITAVSDFPP